MPSALTYPGVYIEELSSGVRTITGVATSITLFVGWAPQGPTDRALRVLSFTDYVRKFGPIHGKSYLGYSVKQFFDNGGSDAYVLRLADSTEETAKCSCGGLNFKASSSGTWPAYYGVVVKARGERFTVTVVQYQTDDAGNPITNEEAVKKSPPTAVEVFPNVSTNPADARYVEDLINDEKQGSLYIKFVDGDSASDEGPVQLSGGSLKPPEDIDDIASADQPWIQKVVDAIQEDGILDRVDLFNLLCVPGMTDKTKLSELLAFCRRRRAMLIADCETSENLQELQNGPGISGDKRNGSFYFPWVNAPDPLSEGRIADFPPCGFMAGLYAKTDATRGVWKAPAGTEAGLTGASGLKYQLTDKENGTLNIRGVNCLRQFPVYGAVSWGARTIDGDDEAGSEWKYIPVRRTALYIEESLYRGTKWAVFEPNDEPLWAQLRLNIGAFMRDLFRQGAFQGRTPREAYFVKCDKETTTQNDINRGIVNVIVGFAPLKPAEFVVIKLTQIAGQIEV
jgi:phage tail sheath protein FI